MRSKSYQIIYTYNKAFSVLHLYHLVVKLLCQKLISGPLRIDISCSFKHFNQPSSS
uniref:Uncharacterized protein n=1 Tax=Anguilla anguilla TaxID=7936 RepID=A0A0E9QK79_ANGAN